MEQRLKLNSDTETVVRMYGQGFGDCFLLAFPRFDSTGAIDRNNPVYVVIDSGVFFQTPQDRDRMKRVANSIKEATGGVIDLLIATHEHHDHLCGFEYAKEVWKEIGVKRVWVAWTEKKDHPDTKRYDQEAEALKKMAEAAKRAAEKKKKENPALADSLEAAFGLVAFRGEPFYADENPFPVLTEISVGVDKILNEIVNKPKERFHPGTETHCDFCEPKEVRTVPDSQVDAYILGPPTDPDWLGMDFPKELQQIIEEVYHSSGESGGGTHLADFERGLALDAAAERAERVAFGDALEQYANRLEGKPPTLDRGAPFSSRVGIPYDKAKEHPFFKANYFLEEKSALQIDDEWLRGASRFALQMDRLTNNTSLVVAFRLPDGRVLLFVGDAQVGNWLSWQTIKPTDWKRPEGGEVAYRPTANELLGKVAVYKVGHHGSHNATVKASGLEKMPDDFIAFIPSSQRYPQEFQKNGKNWSIPLQALVDRLRVKCKGKVILPHDAPDNVESSNDSFEEMTRDEGATIVEAGVPVWQQIRV